MSWRKNTARNFQFDLHSTPYNVGPGSYDIESTPRKQVRSQTPAFKNREKRKTVFDKAKFTTPAPGMYSPFETDKHIKITSSFKTSSRRKVFEPTEYFPSPADHSNLLDWVPKKKQRSMPESYINKPVSNYVGQDISGFDILEDGTLRPKRNKRKDERWIGPGSYNIDFQYNKGYSINRDDRKIELASKERVPGPGAYNTRTDTPGHPQTISKAKRGQQDVAAKGYELNHKPWNQEEHDISSPFFKSRTKREIFVVTERTPDPTNYQNTQRKRPKSAKAAFGQKSPRFIYKDNDVPGPGAYEAEDCMWITSTTPTGRHAHDVYNPGNGVPGPGSYEPQTTWEKKDKRPSSVFASKVKRKWGEGTANPGPGSYTIDTPRSESKVKIHASRTNKTNNFFEIPTKSNPSPDMYYMDRSLKNGKTIPKDKRFEKEPRNPTPGPGEYKVTHGSLIKKSFNSELIGVV